MVQPLHEQTTPVNHCADYTSWQAAKLQEYNLDLMIEFCVLNPVSYHYHIQLIEPHGGHMPSCVCASRHDQLHHGETCNAHTYGRTASCIDCMPPLYHVSLH